MRPSTSSPMAAAQPAWWQRPYRMVQTNLRQPDALVDQKYLARQTREFGADVLLYNIGGIFAFYPTELPLQARNPMMQGDALGAIIEAAHAEGLALVGRFDLSKATRIAYEAHPEWFVHNREGRPLEYNGTYQACVNGGWYQDYGKRIIREALGKYDVDGVFFNMMGYRSYDYHHRHFGICVCGQCQRLFREMFGKALPLKEDYSDPAFRDYKEFQRITADRLADDIYATIKAVNPKVAVTGQRNDCDLIRMEVQRQVDRPMPEWAHQAGDQGRWAAAFGKGKSFSSTSTNFIDFAWRFVAETGAYHMLRFAQQLATGAALDYYLLGVFDQDDTKPFPAVKQLFAWHKENQAHYQGLRSAARVGLYHSYQNAAHRGATLTGALGEQCFRGAYRMLVEARIPFDYVCDEQAGDRGFKDTLARYDAILLPNIACMSDAEAEALDAYAQAGGLVIATGETGFYDETGRPRAAPAMAALPITQLPMARDGMRGAYFKLEPGEVDLPGTTLMHLDGRYFYAAPVEGAETQLELLPPQRFGPPELCFPEVTGSDLHGVIAKAVGRGRVVYLPWLPEQLYFRDSLPDHRQLVTGLIRRHAPPAPATLEGKGMVEVTIQEQAATGRRLVHLINYNGQRNNLYQDPAEIHGLRLGILGRTGTVRLLVAGVEIEPSHDGTTSWLDLPPLGAFEVVSFAG